MPGINIIIRITGIPALRHPLKSPRSPHIMPNMAKSKPDIPTVDLSVDIGKKLAATAIKKPDTTFIFCLMFHRTNKLASMCHMLACWKL